MLQGRNLLPATSFIPIFSVHMNVMNQMMMVTFYSDDSVGADGGEDVGPI